MSKVVRMVQLGQLDRAYPLLRAVVSEKLPFKASYWLRRNLDIVTRVYQPFIEAKQQLFQEFAVKDEKGQIALQEDQKSVKLISDRIPEFWSQYSELAAKEVELDIFPLKIEWFDKLEITVEELAAIEFLFEEEVNEST